MQIIATVVGASFRPSSAKQQLLASTIGDAVTLEPDPDNEYDEYAVKVIINFQHVGFIPKGQNQELFEHLITDREVQAEIIAYESNLRPVLEINL